MELKINIVEAAAELAERELEMMYKQTYPDSNEQEIHNMIWTEDTSEVPATESCTMIYTDEAQDLFSTIYDVIFDVLLKCKTVENVKGRN